MYFYVFLKDVNFIAQQFSDFPNLHHPSRSTILKNGRLLGGKVFFSSNKRHLITFSAPPTPRKMGNLFIEVTLCLYKGCSIPTSRIIVTSHEFRILLIDQPVLCVIFLHVTGQLVYCYTIYIGLVGYSPTPFQLDSGLHCGAVARIPLPQGTNDAIVCPINEVHIGSGLAKRWL